MMEKLSRFWSHKSWKVRHGLLQFVAEAVSTTGEAALAPPRDENSWVLNHVIQLVGDPERCGSASMHHEWQQRQNAKLSMLGAFSNAGLPQFLIPDSCTCAHTNRSIGGK